MKKLMIAPVIILVVLLGVCLVLQLRERNVEVTEPVQTTPVQATPSQPATVDTQPTPMVNVTFRVGQTVYCTQSLASGNCPEKVQVDIRGIRFVQWLDSDGVATDPASAPVADDVTYYAEYYPQLTDHVCFLYTDTDNRLHPDDALIADDLTDALTVLAADGAFDYYPRLPADDNEVSRDELKVLLECFFEAERVDKALPQDEKVTRAAFATTMVTLLGYSVDERITIAPGTIIAEDVTADRADAIALLQASVNSQLDENGSTWADVGLPSGYEPGFVHIDGWLYYVDDNGYFLKNDSIGSLKFGTDGRYTCGDAALDATVAELLKGFLEENPEMTRLEILREVYDYCHEGFTYRRTYENPDFGETGWEIAQATAMFEKGKGNCYSFAAIFWALSRGLAYETRAISGACLKDVQPHSWCIIEIDGADYFFDPEWQYAYHERGVFDKDMFMIPMDKASYWNYKWVEE